MSITYTTRHGRELPERLRLVVLVDHGTASAAEILAAALQDHGVLVSGPSRTAGAVRASMVHTVPGGHCLSVSVARILSPLGSDYEGVGVTPDVPDVEAVLR